MNFEHAHNTLTHEIYHLKKSIFTAKSVNLSCDKIYDFSIFNKTIFLIMFYACYTHPKNIVCCIKLSQTHYFTSCTFYEYPVL